MKSINLWMTMEWNEWNAAAHSLPSIPSIAEIKRAIDWELKRRVRVGVSWASFCLGGYGRGHPPMLRNKRDQRSQAAHPFINSFLFNSINLLNSICFLSFLSILSSPKESVWVGGHLLCSLSGLSFLSWNEMEWRKTNAKRERASKGARNKQRSPINQTKEINQCCSLGGIGWFLWWVMGRSPSAPQDNPFH